MGHIFLITITLLTVTLHSYTYPLSAMVNRRSPPPTLIGIIDSNDVDTLAEMCAAMDKLCHQNQTLENNIHNIRRRQQQSKKNNIFLTFPTLIVGLYIFWKDGSGKEEEKRVFLRHYINFQRKPNNASHISLPNREISTICGKILTPGRRM